MRTFAFSLCFALATAQEGRVFPAVKLAGAGAFGPQAAPQAVNPLQDFPVQLEEVVFEAVSSQGNEGQVQLDSLAVPVEGRLEPLNLPAGASLLLGAIDVSFTCGDNPYGYYADVRNGCAIFHICLPALFSDGRIDTYQYSFLCGENTVFDQEKLTCVDKSGAISCEESPNFYFRNEEFGLPEEKL